ncbi:uracil-DNA glycosylase [Clostridiaceae bacterium M8S5]|nr:uracil-DNA glycosylase [Clostridiaceae bacterium M8S5]
MYTLDDVRQFCFACTKCRLHETRNNVVFGQGNEKAVIMFIGEGPGYNEDKQGIPFVGAAGKLLDDILKAIDLSRDDVYIANIVKCRPPGNRNPLDDEMESCIDYLRWQVKLIKPQIIVCLGSVAAKNIIRQDFRITRERGEWIKKGEYLIMPTYHPAAVLRDVNKKKPVWEDFKKIKQKYNDIIAMSEVGS